MTDAMKDVMEIKPDGTGRKTSTTGMKVRSRILAAQTAKERRLLYLKEGAIAGAIADGMTGNTERKSKIAPALTSVIKLVEGGATKALEE